MDGSLQCVIHLIFFEMISDKKKSFFLPWLLVLIVAYKVPNFTAQVILEKATEKAKALITTKSEFIDSVNQV